MTWPVFAVILGGSLLVLFLWALMAIGPMTDRQDAARYRDELDRLRDEQNRRQW